MQTRAEAPADGRGERKHQQSAAGVVRGEGRRDSQPDYLRGWRRRDVGCAGVAWAARAGRARRRELAVHGGLAGQHAARAEALRFPELPSPVHLRGFCRRYTDARPEPAAGAVYFFRAAMFQYMGSATVSCTEQYNCHRDNYTVPYTSRL